MNTKFKALMHKTSKDTCFEIIYREKDGSALLFFYNYNLYKISGHPLQSCAIGYCSVPRLRPMGEYIEVVG
jgi:hypothetical protein